MVRSDHPCGNVEGRDADRNRRASERKAIWPDYGASQPHRPGGSKRGEFGSHRQSLCQPIYDRRGRRIAAFWWRRAVRHRAEGGRTPLPAALLRRASDIRSEEHTSELQSLMRNSYAVFCLKKKKKIQSTRIK